MSDHKLLVVARSFVPVSHQQQATHLPTTSTTTQQFLMLAGSRGVPAPSLAQPCTQCDANLKLVERCKEELSRRAKEDAARLEAWTTMRGELEARLSELEGSSSKRMMDAVVEIESHKSRAARAERERDALQFQLHEVERLHRADRDEEQGIRETLNSRVSEYERRANIVELQRSRAETEASAARQQLEHWRSSARAAQDEIAALRAQVDQLRSRLTFASSSSAAAGAATTSYGVEEWMSRGGGTSDTTSPAMQFGRPLSPRQRPVSLVAAQARAAAAEQVAKVEKENASERIRALEAEARRLSEALDDLGQAKTLKARLEREQMRRKMQEVRDEAGKLRESLAAR